MNDQRLQLLLKFMEEDPTDPFNIYAIATEYKNLSPEKAITYFEELFDKHPDYLPTYYHAAEVYITLGKNDLAEMIYKKGITLAQLQQEHNTLRELKNAYNEFLFE